MMRWDISGLRPCWALFLWLIARFHSCNCSSQSQTNFFLFFGNHILYFKKNPHQPIFPTISIPKALVYNSQTIQIRLLKRQARKSQIPRKKGGERNFDFLAFDAPFRIFFYVFSYIQDQKNHNSFPTFHFLIIILLFPLRTSLYNPPCFLLSLSPPPFPLHA